MWKIEDEIENRGIRNGELLKMICQIRKKYQRGKTAEQMADDLKQETNLNKTAVK